MVQAWPDRLGRCLWPGCRLAHCQIDHTVAWFDQGATSPANAGSVCGHHNRFKTRGYTTRRDQHGHGHTYRPDGTIDARGRDWPAAISGSSPAPETLIFTPPSYRARHERRGSLRAAGRPDSEAAEQPPACTDRNPEWWFDERQFARGKRLCARCIVPATSASTRHWSTASGLVCGEVSRRPSGPAFPTPSWCRSAGDDGERRYVAGARCARSRARCGLPSDVRGIVATSSSRHQAARGRPAALRSPRRAGRPGSGWRRGPAPRTPSPRVPTPASGMPTTATSATPTWVRGQHALHRLGPHVLTARGDQVAPPPEDTEPAVSQPAALVAGGQPAVNEQIGAIPVRPQQHRAAHVDLATGVDADLDTIEGPPSYTTPDPVSVIP